MGMEGNYRMGVMHDHMLPRTSDSELIPCKWPWKNKNFPMRHREVAARPSQGCKTIPGRRGARPDCFDHGLIVLMY